MKVTAEVSRLFGDRADMLKAATNIILEDDKDRIVIKNVRVIEGKNGLFMSLPARRNIKNEFKEICYPLSANLRERMSAAVLAAYEQALKNPPTNKTSAQ